MRTLAVLLLCLAASGCATAHERTFAKVISPAQSGNPTSWTESEQQAPKVIRNLRRTPEASFHLVRVKTELVRRLHDNSDLSMVVVSGHVELTLGDETFQVAPGDVVEIPRGSAYGVLNRQAEAGVFYQVFTPALAADDTHEKPEPTKDNPWRWNLWQQ
jgi:mannose-6-phosphate isomerase-like protein (cupin superfamily)